jgi:hypothetical protein
MTSAQLMPSGHDRRSVPRVACVVATVLTGALAAGCGSRLKEPAQLASPYAGVQLWAVAPFANESGVSPTAWPTCSPNRSSTWTGSMRFP